jgi:integration host factor subunit alpha
MVWGPIRVHREYESEHSQCACFTVPPTAKKKVFGTSYCGSDIVNFVRFRTGYSRAEVQEIYDEIFHFLGQQIARGRQVMIPGFGSWYSHIRPQRVYKGGYSEKAEVLPPRKLLRFRLSSYLVHTWRKNKYNVSDPSKDWPTLLFEIRRRRAAANQVYRVLVKQRKKK